MAHRPTHRAHHLLVFVSVACWILFGAMALAHGQTLLLANDGQDGDEFGYAVSLYGDTVVIGAPRFGAPNTGAAYVFQRDQGGPDNWGQVKKLDATGGDYGVSAAIDSDTALVGARDTVGGYGRAAVHLRNHGGVNNWGRAKVIYDPDGSQDNNHFGTSVAVTGDIAVVGAPHDDEAGYYSSGAVYLFGRNQGGVGNWGLIREFYPSDRAAGDRFGHKVALHGTTLVVGAPTKNGNYQEAGAAYVFEQHYGGTDSWGQVAKLTAPDSADQDFFGEDLAIDGDILVVGAPTHTTPEMTIGRAYIFERNHGGANSWGLIQKITPPNAAAGLGFARAVEISSGTVFIGNPDHRFPGDVSDYNQAAYVYERTGPATSPWTRVSRLPACSGDGNVPQRVHFADSSVSGSSGTVVVGAANYANYSFRGAAYVYNWLSYPGTCYPSGVVWEPVRRLLWPW